MNASQALAFLIIIRSARPIKGFSRYSIARSALEGDRGLRMYKTRSVAKEKAHSAASTTRIVLAAARAYLIVVERDNLARVLI